MGKYLEAVKGYSETGTEAEMWKFVKLMDSHMCELEQKDPAEFWKIMRGMHAISCGAHYNEVFAKHDVSKMFHTDEMGNKVFGEYWTIAQVKEAVTPYLSKIPSTYNIYDAYVALNANWHDKVKLWKKKLPDIYEQEIIEDAINFYMLDEDAPEGKVWIYIQSLKNETSD